MPIIGASPWTDAANYGAGAGQALGEALTQVPQQRYMMALQQARMAQQQQMGLARLSAMQQLRDVQMQAAQARIAEAQQGLAHYQSMDKPQQPQSKYTFVKEVGLPMDITTGKWGTAPTAQSGGPGVGGQVGLPSQNVAKPETPFQADEQALRWSQLYAPMLQNWTNAAPAQQQLMNMVSNRLYNAQPSQPAQFGTTSEGPTNEFRLMSNSFDPLGIR